MGSFVGHAVPGGFFVLFGLWYLFQTTRNYYASVRRGHVFTSRHSFPCKCPCGRGKTLPVESFVKILFTVTGCVGEIVSGVGYRDYLVQPGNAQHATMFFFFGLSAAVDVLVHYRVQVPVDAEYVFSVVAFFVEWLLFKFHLHGRSELDVRVHTLLIHTIFLNMLAVMAEMKYRKSVWPALARGFFFLTQGTWFLQIGEVLYLPISGTPWKENDHDQISMVTLFFTWHCAVNLIFTTLMSAINAFVQRRKGSIVRDEIDELPMKSLLQHKSNGQTVVRLGSEGEDSDSESQISYEK